MLHLLSTIVSVLFLLLLPSRLSKLHPATVKVVPEYRRYVKIVRDVLFIGLIED